MAGDCEEDEDVVVPEVRRKVDEGAHVAMGRDMVLLCVCAGYNVTFTMVIILDRIMGDEVDADLGKDLVEAIASV
jgi:hypothetical protein